MVKKGVSVRKSFLIRWYEKIFPEKYDGQYDAKKDFKHLILMLMLIILFMSAIGWSWYSFTEYQKEQVSSELLIPSTSFTSAQTNNVVTLLSEQGFKNISYDAKRGVTGWGTPEMVSAYKDSYKINNIDSKAALLDNDYSKIGVYDISISEDYKTIDITTILEMNNSLLMSKTLRDSYINTIISEYSTWCQMIFNGEKLTINFKNLSTGETYFSTQASNVDEIISILEKNESTPNTDNNADEKNENKSATEETPEGK